MVTCLSCICPHQTNRGEALQPSTCKCTTGTSHDLRAGCASGRCAISTCTVLTDRCLQGTWSSPSGSLAALHIKCRTASIGTGGPATKRPPDTDRVLVTDTINRVGFWMLPLSRIISCLYINFIVPVHCTAVTKILSLAADMSQLLIT